MSLFGKKDDDMRDITDQEQDMDMDAKEDMSEGMSSGGTGHAADRMSDTRMVDSDMSAERQEELRRQDREKRDQALDDAM